MCSHRLIASARPLYRLIRATTFIGFGRGRPIRAKKKTQNAIENACFHGIYLEQQPTTYVVHDIVLVLRRYSLEAYLRYM